MLEQESEVLLALVQVKDHDIALLFANHLLSLDIKAQVERHDNEGFVVYCAQEKLTQAKQEFEIFIKQPYHSKYQQAAWQHGQTTEVNVNQASLLAHFKTNFLAHAGMVTLVVFALCWLIFIASSLGWEQSILNSLQFYPRVSVDALLDNPLKLLGPAFIHYNLLHITFNTMWWWQLGGCIEKTLGRGVLVNLLLISAICSNLGQFIVSGPNFGGLSGVVYALVGFVWWYGYLVPERGVYLSKPIVGFMLFWLLLGFVDLLPINMANTAHLLGLLSGCLFAVLVVISQHKA